MKQDIQGFDIKQRKTHTLARTQNRRETEPEPKEST